MITHHCNYFNTANRRVSYCNPNSLILEYCAVFINLYAHKKELFKLIFRYKNKTKVEKPKKMFFSKKDIFKKWCYIPIGLVKKIVLWYFSFCFFIQNYNFCTIHIRWEYSSSRQNTNWIRSFRFYYLRCFLYFLQL